VETVELEELKGLIVETLELDVLSGLVLEVELVGLGLGVPIMTVPLLKLFAWTVVVKGEAVAGMVVVIVVVPSGSITACSVTPCVVTVVVKSELPLVMVVLYRWYVVHSA